MKSTSSGKTIQNCPACKGQGSVNGQSACPVCNGNGQVVTSPFRQPFAYVFNAVVPANGAVPVPKQLSSESDFEWVATVATYTNPNLTANLVDNTNVQFTSDPIQIALFAGTAQLPFPASLGEEPYTFGGGTVLTVTFADSSGAQNTVQLVMWGFKRIKGASETSSS